MAAPTLRDVLFSHIKAREAYERFIELGSYEEQARNAVALLVYLDQGRNNVINHLPALTIDAVFHLAHEAKAFINCLHQTTLMIPPTPLMSALCQDNGLEHAGLFAFNQEHLVHGVAEILDTIGHHLIFSDRLYHLLRRHQTGLLGRNMELEAPYAGSPPVVVPEDCRSMFITFSRNQAVERDEIFEYFRDKWGDCIVRVLLEKTNGAPPMYGRVIFKSAAFVSLALNGEERVSIFIRDREIWLRKYIPRQNNSSQNNNV